MGQLNINTARPRTPTPQGINASTGAAPPARIGLPQGVPYFTIFQFAYAIYSYRKGKRAKAKARRERNAAIRALAKTEVRTSGTPHTIPFAYGLCYIERQDICRAAVPNTLRSHIPPRRGAINPNQFTARLTDQILGDALTWGVKEFGTKKIPYQYAISLDNGAHFPLSVVRILCKAPVSGVANFEINDVISEAGTDAANRMNSFTSVVVDVAGAGVSGISNARYRDDFTGEPLLLKTTNSVGWGNAQRGYGLCKVTEFFGKTETAQPQEFLNGIPKTGYWLRGRNVRKINRITSPHDPDRYELSTIISGDNSHNAVLILLDYLLDIDGGNFKVSEIDLESFYNAADIAQKRVADVKFSLSSRSVYERFASFDADSQDTMDGYMSYRSGARYRVTKHEFHGLLDTVVPTRQNIETILESMPGAQLILRNNLVSITIPNEDWTTDRHIVDTITDSDLITPIAIDEADSDDRSNTYTVTFNNALNNLSASDVVYSNDDYLKYDNDLLLHDNDSIVGPVFPVQADYIAGVRLSAGRGNLYSFATAPNKILLQEGDVIKLKSDVHDLDVTVIILAKDAAFNGITFQAQDFDIADYTFKEQAVTRKSTRNTAVPIGEVIIPN